ncbi:hypothetical protein A3J23_04490 [Candidatus Peregrinibacteria bacterium RIFCSPLOWO2_02_FULL_48_14]|nr:MAG: hypothetical protein A2974_03080 [Candidatus Peregrinibacteria bacterium RIFCSPLOWO2_01_FULL_48_20]OGJ43619.1 MAG: hypothetical protein A3J23_04490 [Candidatus Peregrinibacteria bacterium RIFCSPLOWO2_02_FULL_48_14]
MRTSLTTLSGVAALMGVQIATVHAEAKEPAPISGRALDDLGRVTILSNPAFKAAQGKVRDLSERALLNGYMLNSFGTYPDMSSAMSGHTDDLLLVQSGPNFVEYEVFEPVFLKDGSFEFQLAGNPADCRDLGEEEFSGYYEVDGKRFYVLKPDNFPNHDCPSEIVGTVHTLVQDAAAPSVPAKMEKSRAPIRLGLGVGGDMEDTGMYNLGFAPHVTLNTEWQPLKQTFLPGLTIGLSGNALFSAEGSGFEGLQAYLGYKVGHVGLYGLGGMSFEPRLPGSVLDGAPSVGLLAGADIFGHASGFGMSANLQAQQDFYGQEPGTFNTSAWISATYLFGSSLSVSDVQQKASVPHEMKVQISEVPYSDNELQPKSYGEVPAEVKAEHVRLSEELQKGVKGNKWEKAELHYLEIQKLGVPLSFDEYHWGAEAARGLGNMQECYLRLRWALQLEPHDEVVKAWIQDIEKNYASVLLEVSKDYEGNKDLLPKERPFPPDQNAAITYAQATLQETGRFEGFLPTVTAYSFGEQELTLMPEGPRSEIPRTTTRVSLEHLESKG